MQENNPYSGFRYAKISGKNVVTTLQQIIKVYGGLASSLVQKKFYSDKRKK